jgi:hypothetical protein
VGSGSSGKSDGSCRGPVAEALDPSTETKEQHTTECGCGLVRRISVQSGKRRAADIDFGIPSIA